MQGKTINGYTLKHLLGKGGMAEVWYAENSLGKKAAVKFLKKELSANEDIVERFRNEAKVMVSLDHPNIRQVYDYAEMDEQPAIIMEYLEGEDLKTWVKLGHRFTDDELVKLWNESVDALNFTHSQGVVHRDIKPSNLFITNKGVVKILDFGIAKIKGAMSGTQTGQKMGTLVYMSPEQIKDSKHIDYRTDVYSLAVTFVNLLQGHVPYDDTRSSEWEIMNKIVSEPLDLSGLSPAWCEFLQPYLKKEQEQRPSLRHFTNPSIVGNENPGAQESDTMSMKLNIGASCEDNNTFGQIQDHERNDEGTIIESNPSRRPKAGYANFSSDNIHFEVNGIGFNMKKVESGAFWMGAHNETIGYFFKKEPNLSIPNYDENANSDECPVHLVTLSDFYMGETEVTQALWKAVKGVNPSCFLGDEHPVEQVNWDECQDFISELNSLLSHQLRGLKFALPTEAEWEYAARGGKKNKKGFRFSGSNCINDVAWHSGNSDGETHPVAQKQPNELGIKDMCGNVWEWCHDLYSSYNSNNQTNPTGPDEYGTSRVLRGGCFLSDSVYQCRVSCRSRSYPGCRNNGIGFRLVLR